MNRKKTNQTSQIFKLAVACKELTKGLNGCFGGDKLAPWLVENQDCIDDIVVASDRILIQFKPDTQDQASEFINKLDSENIGDEKWWLNTEDDKWYLVVWWD